MVEPFAIQEETVSTEFAPETQKSTASKPFEGAAFYLIYSVRARRGERTVNAGGGGLCSAKCGPLSYGAGRTASHAARFAAEAPGQWEPRAWSERNRAARPHGTPACHADAGLKLLAGASYARARREAGR